MEVAMEIKVLIALLVSFKVAEAIRWYVKEGEMAVLKCPLYVGPDASLTWTYATKDGVEQTNHLSPAGNMSVLTHRKYLIILNASTSHQGNYSCSLGNASIYSWQLLLCSEARCLKETYYPQTCYEGTSCTLKCPHDLFIPQLNRSSSAWHKEDVLLQYSYNITLSKVTEKDSGVFTCTMSYLYDSQLYNWTHSIDVFVENNEKSDQLPAIISPQAGQVFEVDLGSVLVIDCKAFLDSDFDEVYWINGASFVSDNRSLTVYSNSTRDDVSLKMTASLVFVRVSEEHLSNPYTCILDSTAVANVTNVTVTLTRRAPTRTSPLVPVVILAVVVLTAVALTVLYVKLRFDITLFVRDAVRCYSKPPDGKVYDAYMMCYKSDTDSGLSEEDRRWLEKVLEEQFGYKLCLYDRDVLPGEAAPDAVLSCIEQSCCVVLIPTHHHTDPGSDPALRGAVHAALAERQTHTVLIQTTDPLADGSLPEDLRLNARPAVTWRGSSSQPLSSPFWKRLRCHLPAPLHLKRGSDRIPSYQTLQQSVV